MGLLSKVNRTKRLVSIRTKLGIIIMLLIGGISLFVFVYFPARLKQQAGRAITTKARSIASMTAFSISPALLFEDSESMEDALEGAKQNKDLVYIVIVNEGGRIAAAFNQDKAERAGFTETEDNRSLSPNADLYKAMTPILHRNRQIGRLYLGLSLEALKTEIVKSRTAVAWVSLLILVLGMIALLGTSALVTGPLGRMVETVKRISDGDLTQRVSFSSQDEIGHLASSFNLMVDHLESAQAELQDANHNLQRRAEELHREITERKRAEAKLEETLEKLQWSNTELQHFAYVASHDLQEPLRMVASYVQLLQRRYQGKLDSDADDFIAYSVDGTIRMQNLINDLLTYSRVGTRAKEFEPTDCQTVVRQVLDNLQAAIRERGARVTTDPLPTLMADPSQLGQLFQNLIANAIKFCDRDYPRIHVSAREKESEWEFAVSDNGIGIAKEFLGRIFEIFKRLHTRKEYAGTGIGLAVCKKIVERHGGRIWVDSEPGQGSTFHFTILKKVREEVKHHEHHTVGQID